MATKRPAGAQKPETEPDLERFGELLQLHGSESRLYLYRVSPRLAGSKEEAWLERFDEEAPTLESIRESYGGGTFRLRLLDGGKRIPGAEVLFSIEGDPKFQGGQMPATPAPAAGGDRIDRLLQLLERKLAADDDEDRRESRRRERLLADMALARELRGGGGDAQATVDLALRMVELFREGAAAGAAGGSAGGDPDAPWWSEMVSKLADVLTRPPAPIARRPNPAMAVPPAPPPVLPPAPHQGEPMNLSKLLDDLAELLADERIGAPELVDAFRLLPRDMIGAIVAAGRESWLAFFARESATRPILGTERAQAILGELWDLLSAPPA